MAESRTEVPLISLKDEGRGVARVKYILCLAQIVQIIESHTVSHV